WSITSASLASGVHNIAAKATDVAGNVGATSAALAVTITAQAPAAPVLAGASASVLSGTGEVGASGTILNGTASAGTAAVGSTGTWDWQFLAGTAVRTVTAVQTNVAGITSGASNTAIIGTSGADRITGTSGNDLLIGGGGADIFTFGRGSGADIIADFTVGG